MGVTRESIEKVVNYIFESIKYDTESAEIFSLVDNSDIKYGRYILHSIDDGTEISRGDLLAEVDVTVDKRIYIDISIYSGDEEYIFRKIYGRFGYETDLENCIDGQVTNSEIIDFSKDILEQILDELREMWNK